MSAVPAEQQPDPLAGHLPEGGYNLARLEEAVPPADRHPAAVYLSSLSKGSRRTIRQALDRIAELVTGGEADADELPWHRLEYRHARAIRTRLREEYAPATVNKFLSALRGVMREAWRLELVEADRYQRIADVEGVSADRLPAGRGLSLGELHRLRGACEADENGTGERDLALIAAMARAGLRRSEVVALDLEDLRPLEDDRAELVVRDGKGGKDRVVPVANGTLKALEAWVRVRGREPGPLFTPVDRFGNVTIRRLSTQAIYSRLQRRAAEAGIEEVSPHDLRRTFVSDLLDAGNDLSVTRDLAGHASTDTTARYDRRGERAKREAVETLAF